MLTSNTHQQSLVDAGSETRPPMLERGPYKFKEFTPSESEPPRMQKEEDLKGDDLKHYEAKIEVDRETRFTNKFDQFVAEPGEALVSVYNRFVQLMNDLERNGIIFPKVTINTKFLNFVQPEWLKFKAGILRTLRSTSSGTAANVQCCKCSMIQLIQPKNFDSDEGPSYDSAFLSEVQTPSTSYVNRLFAKDTQEQKYLKQPKIINNTIGDDQIDSNIIFDDPNGYVNTGSVKYDNNVQESYELEQLARNAYKEAEKQQIIAKKLNNKTQC
ncbi:hypothetical protein Tco_1327526 [Tanacetum coccineum]